ncbi:MAG: DUF1987 domain-containing protein [Bacteroidota bacterium]
MPEPIYREATTETPEIHFDAEKSIFSIKGKSFPEETRDFFDPIISWLTRYADAPNAETEVTIHMDYYNSSTSVALMEVLKVLERIHLKGNKITIHWHYDLLDEDMLEAGEEYEELLKLPFVYKGVQEPD